MRIDATPGPRRCDAARAYDTQVRDRHEQEAQMLASLTGWNVNDIRRKMGGLPPGRAAGPRVTPLTAPLTTPLTTPTPKPTQPTPTPTPMPWWRGIWN